MVFPGRFSTGCERCRKRKVKCDESKPGCRRCCVYGKPCPGYTDTFRFRNSNTSSTASLSSKSSKSSKSPNQIITFKSENSSAASSAHSGSSPSQASTVWSSPSPSLPQRVNPSYEQVSITYFMNRFVSPYHVNNFPGYLSFVPDLYNDREHGLLELATLSVAHLAAYNQFGGQKFLQQSYRDYGRAIQAMKEAISNEEKALDDRTLAAVILLSTHMDMKGGDVVDAPAHASGLYYLLNRRGPEQLATRTGFELFFIALIQLYAHAILNNDHTYADLNGLIEMMAFYDPLMNAMALVSRVLSLRHALSKQPDTSQMSTDGTNRVQVNEELVKDSFDALDAFDQWDQTAGSCWKRTFEGRSEPMPVGQAVNGGYHFDIQTAGTMVLLRSSRLILLMGLMDYFGRLALEDAAQLEDQDGAWAACIAQLEKDIGMTINDILYFVPYVIGDLDVDGNRPQSSHDGAGALLILHSVRLVSICHYSSPSQAADAKAILERINSAMGVRSAISRVEVGDILEKLGVQRAVEPMRRLSLSFEQEPTENVVKQEPFMSIASV